MILPVVTTNSKTETIKRMSLSPKSDSLNYIRCGKRLILSVLSCSNQNKTDLIAHTATRELCELDTFRLISMTVKPFHQPNLYRRQQVPFDSQSELECC